MNRIYVLFGKTAPPNQYDLEDAIELYEKAAIAFRNSNQGHLTSITIGKG